MGFSYFNPNPAGQKVGDCTVRAIAKATGKSWDEVYIGLCLQGLIMGDLPSANSVWSAYLRQQGFTRNVIPNTCPDCYTVADFCADHPRGVYVLALSSHVVCVEDGTYFDTWDSGGANIAIPTGGTVGTITAALAINGEPLSSATAAVTPAAVENYFNIFVSTFVEVPRGCCLTVAAKNTSAQAISFANSNMIVERVS